MLRFDNYLISFNVDYYKDRAKLVHCLRNHFDHFYLFVPFLLTSNGLSC